MSKPRNPRYFPRMKVRGARRRRVAPIQGMSGWFDRLGYSAFAAAVAMNGLIETLARHEEQRLRARVLGGDAS